MSAANEAFEKSIMAEAGTPAQTWFKRFMWAGIVANLLVGLSLICWRPRSSRSSIWPSPTRWSGRATRAWRSPG